MMLATSLVAILAGCAQATLAPVEERYQPPSEKINVHWVSRGETLYAIAWRYNLDANQLAAANQLQVPYRIYHGQKLTLDMWRAKIAKRTAPRSAKQPASAIVLAKRWQWPTSNKRNELEKETVTKRFSWQPVKGRQAGHKGIDIVGQPRDRIVATQAGTVVYAGTGLSAYGKLLIVKHSDTYLSAYAHNHRLVVAEGDKVKQGQEIAEMGSTGTNKVHLHFEIRKRGVPVNPMSLLKAG